MTMRSFLDVNLFLNDEHLLVQPYLVKGAALEKAVRWGHVSVVRLLLEARASLGFKYGPVSFSPSHFPLSMFFNLTKSIFEQKKELFFLFIREGEKTLCIRSQNLKIPAVRPC